MMGAGGVRGGRGARRRRGESGEKARHRLHHPLLRILLKTCSVPFPEIYRGTSLIINCPPPPYRSLGMVLLQGPTGRRCFISEVSL